jgi:hypothetical protein
MTYTDDGHVLDLLSHSAERVRLDVVVSCTGLSKKRWDFDLIDVVAFE